MSAAQDGLADALTTIGAAREKLRDGDIGGAILHLVYANRYHALALGAHSMTPGAGSLENEKEVTDKLMALRADVIAAAEPRRARPPEVVAVMAEALAPILRELATPGAVPLDVVAARARNAAAIVLAELDVRIRKEVATDRETA